MNPRRHLIARGYAAIVVTLRHLIPLAWIAAVVWATIALPDLASAPTAPLEDLAAKNGAASQAAASRDEALRVPARRPRPRSSSATRSGLRPPRSAARRSAARGVFDRKRPGVPSDIKAALPISNAARGVPAAERGTTAITYLYFPPTLSLDTTTADAHQYANRALGGRAADRSSA